MRAGTMLLKEEKSGHEKCEIKRNERSEESTEKGAAVRKTDKIFREKPLSKGLDCRRSVSLRSVPVLAVRSAVRRIRLFHRLDQPAQHTRRLLPKTVLRHRKPLPGVRLEPGRRTEYLQFCILRTVQSRCTVILLFPLHPNGSLGDGFFRRAVCGGRGALLSVAPQKGTALRHLSFCLTFLYGFYRTSVSFL